MDVSVNLIDPDLFVEHKGPPHEVFDRWRQEEGLHWNPPNPDYVAKVPFSSMKKGFYVLTRYQDVYEVSRDQARFSSYDEGFVIWDQEGPGLENMRANFMGMQPADHSAVKRVITNLGGDGLPACWGTRVRPTNNGWGAEVDHLIPFTGRPEWLNRIKK